jgi:hypothetical protein
VPEFFSRKVVVPVKGGGSGAIKIPASNPYGKIAATIKP